VTIEAEAPTIQGPGADPKASPVFRRNRDVTIEPEGPTVREIGANPKASPCPAATASFSDTLMTDAIQEGKNYFRKP
jgi:hypothetical protein